MQQISQTQELWDGLLEFLKPRMNLESFDLWFRPIRPLGFEDNRFILQVPNKFFSEWIKDHYQELMLGWLKERVGAPVTLQFQISTLGEERSVVPTLSSIPAQPPVSQGPAMPALETNLWCLRDRRGRQ